MRSATLIIQECLEKDDYLGAFRAAKKLRRNKTLLNHIIRVTEMSKDPSFYTQLGYNYTEEFELAKKDLAALIEIYKEAGAY